MRSARAATAAASSAGAARVHRGRAAREERLDERTPTARGRPPATGSRGLRKRALRCTGPGVGPSDRATAWAAIRGTARSAEGAASGSPSSAWWRTKDAEELDLIDGLRGGRVVELPRAVRRDHQHGHEALRGLDHRGQVVRARGARGAHQHARPPGDPRLAEREEGGGALVDDDVEAQGRLPGDGDRQRRGSRARREHHLRHAGRGRRADEEAGPGEVEVGPAHG